MIQFRPEGIYCPQADVYIDPWKPVEKAIITHGHSDHARWGNRHYLCHFLSKEILKLRLGQEINIQTLEYNETIFINGVQISLHPAGHIIGSAQVRLEYQGEVWVVSGDYKVFNDGVSTPFEPVKCNGFITESTFGLPIYDFEPFEGIYDDMNIWWEKNADEGYQSVIIGYSLGKAQNILQHLDSTLGNVFLHGAVANINDAFRLSGLDFQGLRITEKIEKASMVGSAIVAPMSVIGSPWLRKFQPYRIAVCSGWMALRGARRRYGVDKGFVLSDHCDFKQLNYAVQETGAENVYVTHGYQTIYSKWLREEYGLNAVEVKTLFDPTADESINDDTLKEEILKGEL
jgi:putative mRNA 3-end processing factor